MFTTTPSPPRLTPEQKQALLDAILRLVAEARALGITVTWSPLYNATRSTVILALEHVDPSIFGPPPNPD